jgi:hypothetical protein
VLLKETSKFFHQSLKRLKVVVERMLEELTKDVNMGRLQTLLPLKRAHTEVEHDVQVHPCCHGSGTFFHWAFKLLFLSSDCEESEKAFGNNDGGYRFLAVTNLLLGTVS